MTQDIINMAVFEASGQGFQRASTLMRKYGLDAALTALAFCEANGRMRIYGREAGGVGPAA